MTNLELARALGCNPSTTCRYIARGMPTDTVGNAQRWIAFNIQRRGRHRGVKVPASDAASIWLQAARAELRSIKAEMKAKGLGKRKRKKL